MQFWITHVLLVWQIGLVIVLALYSLRASTTAARSVALSALGSIIVAVLALLAVLRSAPSYLDIGLVVAMLGAAQTIAVVRTAERHEGLR